MELSELGLIAHMLAMFEADLPKQDVQCLARNIYHEARGEPLDGMKAVGKVTLNRVNSSRFPDSVCDVVYQTRKVNGNEIAQFSWVVDNPTIKLEEGQNIGSWLIATEIAILQLASNTQDSVYMDGSMFYFNPDKANPSWYANTWEVEKIGSHIFLVDEE